MVSTLSAELIEHVLVGIGKGFCSLLERILWFARPDLEIEYRGIQLWMPYIIICKIDGIIIQELVLEWDQNPG